MTPRALPEADGERGQRGELAGESLGRGDPDLGAGERRRERVGQTGDARVRHVDDADRLRSPLLHVAQRSERVGRLARLRDDDRQAPVVDRRLAIAVFRGDIDLDRQAREPLDPILGREPGHIGGAAGDDRDSRKLRRLDRPGEWLEPHRRHVDVMGEGMSDDLGLLVDLLGHEVTIVALLRQQASRRAPLDAALDPFPVAVANVGAFARHDCPVALLEIGDAIGERGERERVGAQKHLSVAVADRERRALPRADQEVVLAREQIDERERAAQPAERRVHRLLGRLAASQLVLDRKRGDLGIGLGGEMVSLGGKLLAQRLEVLDDAVVDDGEPGRSVRMGVGDRRLAVGRPARMSDTDRAGERLGGEFSLEVLELALGAPPLEPAVFERRDAG